jgi:hypothetical protein
MLAGVRRLEQLVSHREAAGFHAPPGAMQIAQVGPQSIAHDFALLSREIEG